MSKAGKDYPLKDYYSHIYPSYDRVNRIFTFGRDVGWRRKAAAACLQSAPRRILDVCTGTGDWILEIARQAEGEVSLTGYDYNSDMLKEARRKLDDLSGREKLHEVQFVEGDVRSMPFNEGHFDAAGITFGIRNLLYENSYADQHLAEISRVIRTGGHLVILESSKPANRVWRLINILYLQCILPYLGGAISGNLKAYRYLARSSKNYYTIKEMGSILEDAGFRIRSSQPLFLGSVMLVIAEKK